MSVRIASSNLNQTPLDWRGNFNNIKESISLAKEIKLRFFAYQNFQLLVMGAKIYFIMTGLLKNQMMSLMKLEYYQNLLQLLLDIRYHIIIKIIIPAALLGTKKF